jgi:hypothetical protein
MISSLRDFLHYFLFHKCRRSVFGFFYLFCFFALLADQLSWVGNVNLTRGKQERCYFIISICYLLIWREREREVLVSERDMSVQGDIENYRGHSFARFILTDSCRFCISNEENFC